MSMADESYKDYILDLFIGCEGVSSKRMFGGWGIFQNGIIFGIIIDGALYFKVDETNQKDYEDYDSHAFTYIRKDKEVTLSYWLVPEEVIEDMEILLDWALKSLDINIALDDIKAKKAKKAQKSKV